MSDDPTTTCKDSGKDWGINLFGELTWHTNGRGTVTILPGDLQKRHMWSGHGLPWLADEANDAHKKLLALVKDGLAYREEQKARDMYEAETGESIEPPLHPDHPAHLPAVKHANTATPGHPDDPNDGTLTFTELMDLRVDIMKAVLASGNVRNIDATCRDMEKFIMGEDDD